METRVGDSARREVDERLQAAVGDGVLTLHEYDERATLVWVARTQSELDTVVADLPIATQVGVRSGSDPLPGPRRSVAVMGGEELKGPLAPGQDVQAYALMGGSAIDLRRDDLPAEVHVRAVAVMGGIEVLVPRGARVELHGAAFMAGRSLNVETPRTGAPVVHVHAWALMGGVEVKHGSDAPVASTAPPPVTARRSAPSGARRARGLLAGLAVAGAVAGGLVAADAATEGLAVLGNATVNAEPGDTVTVGAVMGNVEVVVPDDAQVELNGVRLLGNGEVDRPLETCDTGAVCEQVVVVNAHVLMGNVEVVREGEIED